MSGSDTGDAFKYREYADGDKYRHAKVMEQLRRSNIAYNEREFRGYAENCRTYQVYDRRRDKGYAYPVIAESGGG